MSSLSWCYRILLSTLYGTKFKISFQLFLTGKSISIITNSCHCTLVWTKRIQIMSSQWGSLIYILRLCCCLCLHLPSSQIVISHEFVQWNVPCISCITCPCLYLTTSHTLWFNHSGETSSCVLWMHSAWFCIPQWLWCTFIEDTLCKVMVPQEDFFHVFN